jgi:hypothetical protein
MLGSLKTPDASVWVAQAAYSVIDTPYLNIIGHLHEVEVVIKRCQQRNITNLGTATWENNVKVLKKSNTSQYIVIRREMKQYHVKQAILISELARHTNPDQNIAYIIQEGDRPAYKELYNRLYEGLQLPLRPQWTKHLYDEGQSAGLIRRIENNTSPFNISIVKLDEMQWADIIGRGIRHARIFIE